MGKKRERGQAPSSAQGSGAQVASRPAKGLTWRQERFVEAYCRNKGNGTRAAIASGCPPGDCARVQASKWLTKPSIQAAIDEQREKDREALSFSRQDALRILVGMAGATLDDFSEVLKKPESKKSYRGLGDKRHALASAKKTVTYTDESERVTNEITIISPQGRLAAINELWIKLGLDKDTSGKDRVSFLERFARMGTKLGRSGGDGGSSGSEGSG